MKSTCKPIQRLLVLAFAITIQHEFAFDTTSEGAKSNKSGQEVLTSSEGVKVHQMKTTEQMKDPKKHGKEEMKNSRFKKAYLDLSMIPAEQR